MFESGNREQAPTHIQTVTVTVTCSLDSRAHAVHDTQMSWGPATGRYNALCGHLVSAAPMTVPDGQPCMPCAELRDPPDNRPRRGLRWR
jgi:hypothetical protein